MYESNKIKDNKAAKDLFELVYVVFRIGDHISGNKFGSIIKDLSLDLFASSARDDKDDRLIYSDSLRQLFSLGLSFGLVKKEEGEYVLEKLDQLASTWKEIFSENQRNKVSEDLEPSSEVLRLAGIESRQDDASPRVTVAADNSSVRSQIIASKLPADDSSVGVAADEKILSGDTSGYSYPDNKSLPEEQFISGEARQLAIFNYIRKSGNCRIREIQTLFPDINERTIRYHLQRLSEKGLVEQVGAASATYYKLKDLFPQSLGSVIS